jgi:hypothetical protein
VADGTLGRYGADRCRPRKRGRAPRVSRLAALFYLSRFTFHLSPSSPCGFASLADVAKGGDGAKSALREIFFGLSSQGGSELTQPVFQSFFAGFYIAARPGVLPVFVFDTDVTVKTQLGLSEGQELFPI